MKGHLSWLVLIVLCLFFLKPGLSETVDDRAGLLGMNLGFKRVGDVNVSLYLLQEAYPERLDSEQPTHLFSVVLIDDKGLIGDAEVSLTVSGEDFKRTVKLKRQLRVYRGSLRIDQLGRYQLIVSFNNGKKSGSASFDYIMMPGRPNCSSNPEPIIQGE
ncbi:MAG: hypothetical protein D6710_09745 [Nitrospirae bacterium]|nr:MAG: hypothetical protein D6710_09745 [Nitrospirota bacterium]